MSKALMTNHYRGRNTANRTTHDDHYTDSRRAENQKAQKQWSRGQFRLIFSECSVRILRKSGLG
jgi:hypothetical protein